VSDDQELVHARYLGETTERMPDLEGRDRCCRKENHREGTDWDKSVLEPGDVILLDRYSAEGRGDFEIVEDHAPKTKARKGSTEGDSTETEPAD